MEEAWWASPGEVVGGDDVLAGEPSPWQELPNSKVSGFIEMTGETLRRDVWWEGRRLLLVGIGGRK
jgi:hypothetical protein